MGAFSKIKWWLHNLASDTVGDLGLRLVFLLNFKSHYTKKNFKAVLSKQQCRDGAVPQIFAGQAALRKEIDSIIAAIIVIIFTFAAPTDRPRVCWTYRASKRCTFSRRNYCTRGGRGGRTHFLHAFLAGKQLATRVSVLASTERVSFLQNRSISDGQSFSYSKPRVSQKTFVRIQSTSIIAF